MVDDMAGDYQREQEAEPSGKVPDREVVVTGDHACEQQDRHHER